jgi:Tol biopolymer transport system component
LIAGLLDTCAAAKAPFTFEAMMRLARIDDPQLSPDGKLVAFTAQTIDLPNNSKSTQIYVVPLDGGVPQRLTNDGSVNTRPRWSPDSKRIFFVSNRSNGSQRSTCQHHLGSHRTELRNSSGCQYDHTRNMPSIREEIDRSCGTRRIPGDS